jgi:hypothetical protein
MATQKFRPEHLTTSECEVIEFAIRNKLFYVPANLPVAFFLMDGYRGGKLFLPPDLESKFLEKYAPSIYNQNAKLYFSEQRTPVYRMHFDIDGLILEFEQVKKLVALVTEILHLFYPRNTHLRVFEVCLLDTSEADLKEPLKKKNKTNLHLILPFMNVTNEEAEPMARACASKASLIVPEVNWNDVFDYRIYSSNGLRLIGSRKADKCNTCRKNNSNKIDADCGECLGKGNVDHGRPYHLRAVFSNGVLNEARFEEIKANMVNCVKLCSIRCPPTASVTPGWVKYATCPPSLSSGEELQEKQESILRSTLSQNKQFERLMSLPTQISSRKNEEKIIKKQSAFCIPVLPGSEEYKVCLQEMRNFKPVYSMVLIDNKTKEGMGLATTKNRSAYRAIADGDGSYVCQNLPATHNNQSHGRMRIYFVIKKSGIVQRCFSKKSDGRLNGSCSNYQSESKPLAEETMRILFPIFQQTSLSLLPPEKREIALLTALYVRLRWFQKNPEILEKRNNPKVPVHKDPAVRRSNKKRKQATDDS